MGSGPNPASHPHPREETGSGPQASSKGDTVENTGKMKLLFPRVLGWFCSRGLTIFILSWVWVKILRGREVEKMLQFCP